MGRLSALFPALLIALGLAWVSPTPPVEAQQPLRLVYFDDYGPFSFRAPDGTMDGILVAVLEEALGNRLAIPLEHSGYPWARAQDLVREGLADGFSTVPTPARREYTVISEEPVVVATFTLFAKTGSQAVGTLGSVTTIADLKPFRIGQYLGSGWAKQELGDFDVDWSPSLHQTLRMLERGRVDVVVGVSQVLRHNIDRLGLGEEIHEIPNVVDSHPFMLCLGKDSPWADVLPRFDATIREMRADGTLDAITARYR